MPTSPLWLEILLAFRNLRRHRNRSIVAVATLATGLVAYLLAGGFIEWIFENMREATIRSQLGHMQIVRPGYLDKGSANPYSYLLPANSEVLEKIAARPEVSSISQRLSFSGLVSYRDNTISFIGEGIEPEREAVISSEIHIKSGRDIQNSTERAALLGEGLAKALGVVPGEKIVLLATTASGSTNAIEVAVAGTFFTASKEFDDSALRLPIELARKLMRVEGATAWVVLLDDTAKTEKTRQELASSLAAGEFEVIPWIDLADFYKKTVELFSRQLDFMKLIIGVIVILTISNTQTMSVLERTTEIGTMMAIGTRPVDVLRLFVLEGVAIGVIGGTLGLLLGFVLAKLLSAIGIPMPPPPGMETGFTAGILVPAGLMLDALLLTLATTLLASLLPALKASRLKVVDALRCNQ